MSRRLEILRAQQRNRPLWEKVEGNPLVERNRDTGTLRAIGLTDPDTSEPWAIPARSRAAGYNGAVQLRDYSVSPEEKAAVITGWIPHDGKAPLTGDIIAYSTSLERPPWPNPSEEKPVSPNTQIPDWITSEWKEISSQAAKNLCLSPAARAGLLEAEYLLRESLGWRKSSSFQKGNPEGLAPLVLYRVRLRRPL